MKIALISVLLCLFVSLNDCRSIKVKREISDEIEKDYSVDKITDTGLIPKKRSTDADELVPVSEKALNRVKKSLTKNRMKRLTKPKYLEEKLKEMLEQRPEMKDRIKSKLAERKTKKQKNPETEFAFEQENLDVYQVPVNYNYNPYDPQAPATPSSVAIPVYDFNMYAAAAAGQLTPEMPAYQPEQAAPETLPAKIPFAIQNEVPFGVFDQQDQEYEPSTVFGRSVRNQIDEDILALQAFEVHPLESKIFETEILPNIEEALLECSFPTEDAEIPTEEPMTEAQEIEEIIADSEWGFLQSAEAFDTEAFESPDALDENMKFKKDIPFTQFAQELFYNSLQKTPDSHFSCDYVLETLPCDDHLVAPLKPIKTYEIKQVTVDKEAIIAEIKSVLGETTGPIIIGEPGEPVIVKHFAKPYVIDYYERPVVVEHHQSANLNVFESKPVVVDHFEPVTFTEVAADPLIIVEEICPCTEEMSNILFS